MCKFFFSIKFVSYKDKKCSCVTWKKKPWLVQGISLEFKVSYENVNALLISILLGVYFSKFVTSDIFFILKKEKLKEKVYS